MAHKRMFTMKICDSDAFLDMPLSSQCLYFHLNMRADDDGFIDNPKRIMRIVGASEDDLKILLAKSFLLSFESGVLVIKHWRMHNTLGKQRYHETQYLEEKSMLLLKENGSYSFSAGEPIEDSHKEEIFRLSDKAENKRRTNGEQAENADIGLGLDLGLDIDLDLEKDIEPLRVAIDYQKIVDAFNRICKSYPQVKVISDNRKKAIRARLKTYSEEDLLTAFDKAEKSDFLKGKNNKDWSATFDWILKESNLAKILEGNYDNLKHTQQVSEQRKGYSNCVF